MSTSLILGTIGAVVGFIYGGPAGAFQGFAIGSAIGGAVDPPTGPDQMGPRLQDLTVQNSSYGAYIPVIYGSYRLSGNVIWSDDIRETKHEEELGKGGGGATSTTFTYSCSFAVSLCEGGNGDETVALRRIFADGRLIYDISNPYIEPEYDDGGSSIWAQAARRIVDDSSEGVFTSRDFVFYGGTETQLPDPTIEAVMGAGNVPAYRGQCYIVFTDMQLAKYGNRIPNLSFEIVKNGVYEEEVNVDAFGYEEDEYLGTCVYNPVRDEVWEFPNFGTSVKRHNPHSGEVLGEIPVSGISYFESQNFGNPTYDPINGFIYINTNGPIIQFDAASATVRSTFPSARFDGVSPYNGYLFWSEAVSGVTRTRSMEPFGGLTAMDINVETYFSSYTPIIAFEGDTGNFWLLSNDTSGAHRFDRNGQYLSTFIDPSAPGLSFGIASMIHDKDRGSMWYKSQHYSGFYMARAITGVTTGTTTVITFAAGTGTEFFVGQTASITSTITGASWLYDTAAGDQHTILATTSTTVTLEFDSTGLAAWVSGGVVSSDDMLIREIDLDTMTVTRTVMTPLWSSVFSPNMIYDDVRRMIWVADGADGYTHISGFSTADGVVSTRVLLPAMAYYRVMWMCMAKGDIWAIIDDGDPGYIYRIKLNTSINAIGTNLAYVVRDIGLRCGLAEDQIDVEQLEADSVRGYGVTSKMSGRAAIEALMNGWVFDSVDSDGVIKFVKRGGTPVALIGTSEMVVKEDGEKA